MEEPQDPPRPPPLRRAQAALGRSRVQVTDAVRRWDERMSTARALAAIREQGGSPRGRRADVDALAAAVLLQHYLDARRARAR